MSETRILGLMITDRIKESGLTQKVLSSHASLIRSRLGFHEVTDEVCSRNGFIIILLSGNPELWDDFEQELASVPGVEVRRMTFNALSVNVSNCE